MKHMLPECISFLQEAHSLKQDEGLWSAQFIGTLKFRMLLMIVGA